MAHGADKPPYAAEFRTSTFPFAALVDDRPHAKGLGTMAEPREAVRNYIRCCEHLLACPALEQPLTDEECEIILYYLREIENKMCREYRDRNKTGRRESSPG